MTAPTPPVSDVLRGMEALAGQSRDMLVKALDLVTQAANADRMAVETAVAALGDSHGRTVVDLARMSVAAETAETLAAIRDAVDSMLGTAKFAARPVSPAPAVRETRASAPPAGSVPDASGRVEMFGIMVPAGRMAEADEVVAAARTSVAQNRKANPYDHYRGKNSWCKSLFLAAFAAVSAEGAAAASAPPVMEEPPAPVPPIPLPPPPRQSVIAAGPVRASRPLQADPSSPTHSVPVAPPPRAPSQGQRLHAHGATAQTIPEEVLQQSTSRPAPRPAGKPTFFKRTR